VSDDEPTATGTAGTAGYAESITELEDILEELEGDQLDVDVLAERVRRASELVKVCRERISRAQADVDAIVAELDEFEGVDDPDPQDAELF
jgi:exodeoxyribonuclease VII small subunit